MSVRDIDRGWKRIAALLHAAAQAKSYVKVGFVGPKADAEHEGGLTNLELGIIHEYGAPNAGIPARPFIGPAFEKNREKYNKQLAIGMAKVFAGTMDTEHLLGIIGAEAAADVKEFVTGDPIPPPLKPATIAAKGSDRPLVDTGRLLGAVSWEVVMAGGDSE